LKTYIRRKRLPLVGYLILTFFVALGFYFNSQRVGDIQKSRVASCQQTYEGIREVFRPFFPPRPRSKEQQANLDKFNRIVDRRKANCTKQTAAP
jgi:hypothetical protein